MFCGVRLFGFFVRMFVGLNDFSRFECRRRTMCFYPAVIFSMCHSVCSDVFLIIDTAVAAVQTGLFADIVTAGLSHFFRYRRTYSLALTLRNPPEPSGRSVSGPAETLCKHSDCKIAALFLLSSAFSLSLPLSEIRRGRPAAVSAGRPGLWRVGGGNMEMQCLRLQTDRAGRNVRRAQSGQKTAACAAQIPL